MQFHHHGYVSGDPRVLPAAGVGLDRPAELPDEVDVLIVGAGPAGMIAAAQLAMFSNVTTRIVDRRPGRLEIGQADGIQARSVETFQAFGFAERIVAEAYWQTEMVFWKPDPADPSRIVRAKRTPDDPAGVSEFPHLAEKRVVREPAPEPPSGGLPRVRRDEAFEALRARSDAHLAATGARPVGFFCRGSASPWTRGLLAKHGYLYDSNAFDDDLPYWDAGVLVLPYALDCNDMKFFHPNGFDISGTPGFVQTPVLAWSGESYLVAWADSTGIAAAVLTPTTDPGNMLVLAGPMIVLYCVGIAVAWLFGRSRQDAPTNAERTQQRANDERQRLV